MKFLTKNSVLPMTLVLGTTAPLLAEARVQGEFALVGGVRHVESNFNTENDIKSPPLNSDAESDTAGFVLPLGELRYRHGREEVYSLFVGTSQDDIVAGDVALKVGGGMKVGEDSEIRFSILPTVVDGETWEDPYRVGEPRDETDVAGDAYLLEYDNLLATGVNLSLGYYDVDIDDELSGFELVDAPSRRDLDRNGDGYYLGVERRFTTGQGSYIEPAIYANRFEADGDAMAFTRLSAGVTYGRQFERSGVALSLRISDTRYDDDNPVFGEASDSLGYRFNLSYRYGNLFGQPNWSFISLAGYRQTDSEVAFFDSEAAFASAGVSYRF